MGRTTKFAHPRKLLVLPGFELKMQDNECELKSIIPKAIFIRLGRTTVGISQRNSYWLPKNM